MNDSFPPLIDGVANAVINYAEILTRKCGKAVVATPYYPDVTDHYPYPVIRYKSIDTTKQVGYRTGYPFSPSTIRELESHNIDIIHSHCPIISTFLARTLRESIHVPIVLTYHTKFDIDIARAVSFRFLQQTAIRFLVKNIEACDDVWVVSKGAGENLRSLGYRGNYTVMENGVDFPKGRVDEEKVTALKKEIGISSDEMVFLFVGRIMWYKGLKISLDALKTIKEAGKKFKMLFVGEGADLEEVKAYGIQLGLERECIFVGAVHDRELLRQYFCCADLFLFPSTFDTNGIVVREAAACSLGSVLIKDSCAAEGIIHLQNGILIEENPESMAKALLFAFESREQIRQIGENAAAQIYISWEQAVEKAYRRYEYIKRKYDEEAPLHTADTFGDDIFLMASDIIEQLNRARNTKDKIKQKGEDFSRRFKENLEKFL